MSANRLTTPMVRMKRDASESRKANAGFFTMTPPWFLRANVRATPSVPDGDLPAGAALRRWRCRRDRPSLLSNFDKRSRGSRMKATKHQEFLTGLIRLHVLHHAVE